METGTLVPEQPQQLKKRLYRNNTGGFIGVVQIDHKGDEQGVNIDPHGTIWLSDAEAVLTARAPKDPANNPFVEQTLIVQDPETGNMSEVVVTPVTLASDEERYAPAQDRYVPTQVDSHASPPPSPAAVAREQRETAGQSPVSAPAPAASPLPAPPGGAATLSGDTPPAGTPEQESWVAEPEAPGQVLQGSLQGAAVPEETAQAQVPPQAPSVTAQAAPQTPGGVEEETGAALPPAELPPEGEYAQAEEVGTPRTGKRARPSANEGGLIGP